MNYRPLSGIILVAFCLTPFTIFSQSVKIGFRLKADTVEVAEYQFSDLGGSQTYLQMPYGGYQIMNPGAYKIFHGKHLEKIELVYTDHPLGVDLKQLNKKRIASLYLLAPEVFNDRSTKWKFIKQTETEGKDVYSMFHGFAITYRAKPPDVLIAEEEEYIKNVLENKAPLKDSTVFKIMERNKSWTKMLIIGDLTGSMSPYSAQLLLWHKLNFKSKAVRYFVFFNDGDQKEDEEKTIGGTGGIYGSSAGSLEEVLEVAFETMERGSGGDVQENDLEALLFGLQKFEDFDQLVMIVDNNSDVRDMELLKLVDKPAKIVLCGTEEGINPQYLEIARESGGSVHTVEEDIYHLALLNVGETIQIGGQVFKIEPGGKFVQLERL